MAEQGPAGNRARRPVLFLSLGPVACSSGPDPQERLAEAQRLLQSGYPDEAVGVVREALEAQPEDAEAQYLLGVALLQAGNTTEALFPLRKAARSEEYAILAGVVLATTLAEAANHEEAIRAAEEVLEQEPDNQHALMVRTRSAIALHNGGVALESADRLLETAPESSPLLHLRAQALAEAGRTDDAEAQYRELMAEPREDDPAGQVRACVSLARMYAGSDDEAQSDRKVVGGQPEADVAGEEASSEADTLALETLRSCEEEYASDAAAIEALVMAYEEMERGDESLALLQRSVERFPEVVMLREALATRLIAADEFEAAEALMEEALGEDGPGEVWASLAAVRMAAADFEGALVAIDEAVARLDPASQEVLFSRADILLVLGRLEEAEVAAAALEPGLYRRTLDARIAHERGNLTEAVELYDRVLSGWPQNYRLRVFAAKAAMQLGDTARARSELLEVTRQAPKETDAALWLARIYMAEGDYGEAAGFARRQMVERGTTTPNAHLLASRAYARNRQPQQAKAMLALLEVARDGRFVADAMAELARVTARQSPTEATSRLEQAIAHRDLDLAAPESEPALTQLLELMVATGELERADQRITALAEASPDKPILQVLMGRVALLRNQDARAQAAFEKALASDPENGPALAGRGLLKMKAGDLAGASEDMDRAWLARPHPDYGYMSARLRLERGDTEGAEQRFREVLVLHPEQAAPANDLAWLLAEQGRSLDEAQAYAERAVRLEPGAEVLDTLGYVHLAKGDAGKAEALFRRALEMNPGYGTARYHLALALQKGGDDAAARAVLQEALASPFPEADQAQRLLAQLESGDAS